MSRAVSISDILQMPLEESPTRLKGEVTRTLDLGALQLDVTLTILDSIRDARFDGVLVQISNQLGLFLKAGSHTAQLSLLDFGKFPGKSHGDLLIKVMTCADAERVLTPSVIQTFAYENSWKKVA